MFRTYLLLGLATCSLLACRDADRSPVTGAEEITQLTPEEAAIIEAMRASEDHYTGVLHQTSGRQTELLAIDFVNHRILVSDAVGAFLNCSTKDYYCIDGYIDFSYPKDWSSGIKNWSVDGMDFEISGVYDDYEACPEAGGPFFKIDYEKAGGGPECGPRTMQYIVSPDYGILRLTDTYSLCGPENSVQMFEEEYEGCQAGNFLFPE